MPFSEYTFNLHQLQIFRTVAHRMSFSRAAEDMILSQPAVSLHIKNLEKAVGLPLFEKSGRQIRLTEAGEQLLYHAHHIFATLQEASESMAELRGGDQGHLRIAADTTAGVYVVPEYLGLFRRSFPDVDINLDVTNRTSVLKGLLSRDVDLAVIGQFPQEKELVAIPFLVNELVVIAWPHHPLANHRRIPLASLSREIFLMREEGSGTRATQEKFFNESGLKIQIGMELASNSAIKEAVANALGIAVVPKRSIGLELQSGQLTLLDVQGFPRIRHWHIIQMRRRFLPPPAANFKMLLLQNHPELEQEKPQPLLSSHNDKKSLIKGRKAATEGSREK